MDESTKILLKAYEESQNNLKEALAENLELSTKLSDIKLKSHTTKESIIEILYKYRVDFARDGRYTEFGVREEDFNDLANDILK